LHKIAFFLAKKTVQAEMIFFIHPPQKTAKTNKISREIAAP